MGEMIVEYLLEIQKADVHKKDMNGHASAGEGVEVCCLRGDGYSLHLLLGHQVLPPAVEAGVKLDSRNGHGHCLALLLGALGANTTTRSKTILDESLQLASKSGKASAVRLLLTAGADPLARAGEDSLTAYEVAEQYQQQRVVEALKEPRKRTGRNLLA